MTNYQGPLPIRTTDGAWAVSVGRSETGDQNDVEIALYRTSETGSVTSRQVFEFLPSAAREIGDWLMAAADALDGEYPSAPNR